MSKMTYEKYCSRVDKLYDEYAAGEYDLFTAKTKLFDIVIQYLYAKYTMGDIENSDLYFEEIGDIVFDLLIAQQENNRIEEWFTYYDQNSSKHEDSKFCKYISSRIRKIEDEAKKKYNTEKRNYSENIIKASSQVKNYFYTIKTEKEYLSDAEILKLVADFLMISEKKAIELYNFNANTDSLNVNISEDSSEEKVGSVVSTKTYTPEEIFYAENTVKKYFKDLESIWNLRSESARYKISLILTYRLIKNPVMGSLNLDSIVRESAILNYDFYRELISPEGRVYTDEGSIYRLKVGGTPDYNLLKNFKGDVWEKFNDNKEFEFWLLDDELPKKIKEKYNLK